MTFQEFKDQFEGGKRPNTVAVMTEDGGNVLAVLTNLNNLAQAVEEHYDTTLLDIVKCSLSDYNYSGEIQVSLGESNVEDYKITIELTTAHLY